MPPFYQISNVGIFALGSSGGGGSSFGSSNIIISDPTGSSRTNHPLTLGQVFKQGEIANNPQAVIAGTPVATTCTVKTRWGDGSAKHAVMSFVIPSLGANASATISFQNQSGQSTTALTKAEMLDAAYNFDAVFEAVISSTTYSASARTMLNADAYQIWHAGAVATWVTINEHGTSTKTYDMGPGPTYKSLTPSFQAEFWPTLNKVRVRVSAEISNTTKLQQYTYNATIKTGNTSPTTQYTQSSVLHQVATGWTREYWIGGAPANLNIKYDQSYFANDVGITHYYEPTAIPSGAQLTARQTAYNNASKTLFSNLLWTSYMPGTGGGGDKAPLPDWTVAYLLSGDYRTRNIMLEQANYAGYWCYRFREGQTGKFIDGASTSGMGLPPNPKSRPTLFYFDTNNNINNSGTTTSGDMVRFISGDAQTTNVTNTGWGNDQNSIDSAHQPETAFIPYIVTGDPYYLDQMHLIAAWDVFCLNPGSRGPSGSNGVAGSQTRSIAWTMRTRQNFAWACPDADVAKSVYTSFNNDHYAAWEGMFNITTGAFNGNSLWNWGASNLRSGYFGGTVPPLKGFPANESDAFYYQNGGLFTNSCSAAIATWQLGFLVMSLTLGKKQGFSTSALVTHLAQWIIGLQANAPNPKLAGAYVIGVRAGSSPQGAGSGVANGAYFTTWPQVAAQINGNLDTAWAGGATTDLTGGYALISKCNAATVAGETGGTTCWNWFKTNAHDGIGWAELPQFSIVPWLT